MSTETKASKRQKMNPPDPEQRLGEDLFFNLMIEEFPTNDDCAVEKLMNALRLWKQYIIKGSSSADVAAVATTTTATTTTTTTPPNTTTAAPNGTTTVWEVEVTVAGALGLTGSNTMLLSMREPGVVSLLFVQSPTCFPKYSLSSEYSSSS